MKNLFFAISLLCLGVSNAQAPLLFSARLNVTNVTGSDPYTITGVVQDESGLWSAADINVSNDSIYHLEGSDLLIYRITSITSASGNNFTIVVDDIMDSGLLPSTGTDWSVVEFTANYQFPSYIGNLGSPFKAAIDNRFKQRVDNALDAAGGGTSAGMIISMSNGSTLVLNANQMVRFMLVRSSTTQVVKCGTSSGGSQVFNVEVAGSGSYLHEETFVSGAASTLTLHFTSTGSFSLLIQKISFS